MDPTPPSRTLSARLLLRRKSPPSARTAPDPIILESGRESGQTGSKEKILQNTHLCDRLNGCLCARSCPWKPCEPWKYGAFNLHISSALVPPAPNPKLRLPDLVLNPASPSPPSPSMGMPPSRSRQLLGTSETICGGPVDVRIRPKRGSKPFPFPFMLVLAPDRGALIDIRAVLPLESDRCRVPIARLCPCRHPSESNAPSSCAS